VTSPDNTSANSGTITFSNCSYSAGLTINGSMTYTVSGDANNYSANVSYNNFTITNGSIVSTLNASMTLTGSYAAPVETLTVSIPYFYVTVNSDFIKLYNYTATGTNNTTTNAYTLSWDYTFESSFINGAVHVATEQQLQGYSYNPYPSLGSVVVTGANNSHVRFSTNAMGQATDPVTIEIDADGNGIYEYMTTMTWAQLEALSVAI